MEEPTWIERDKKVVWHPFTQQQTAPDPLVVTSAFGTKFFTEDGKEYIDANSSWWVNVHGHCHPHIVSAIQEQVVQLDQVIFAGATHPQAIRLAERVVKLLPDPLTKVFFSDNGSTAIEVAIKMVFQYWHNLEQPKKRILALEGAYHGDTFGAMAVGQRGVFNEPFEHFFFDVDFLEFPSKDKEQELLIQAEIAFKTGDFAAIIVEPLIQGSAGMRFYSASWLNQLVAIAKKYQVLVIADEIMTGWGRTGTMFAMDQCNAVADIVCLSKGLTGGMLPMGLTVATDAIYSAFLDKSTQKALLHGHSYTGNPVVCAAGNASLDLFELSETKANIEQLCIRQLAHSEVIEKHSKTKNVAVCGTILRFEIIQENDGYFSSIRDEAYAYFLANNCLIRPLGNVIFVNPPYCITEEELEKVYSVIYSFLDSLK